MAQTPFKNKKSKINIDEAELNPAQARLIRSLNALLAHVLVTDDESVFFDGSAEVMRLCASLIQQARFADEFKGYGDVPYAQQALEYSMDVLHEHMSDAKVVSYDN
jgi:hypothetical protein